MLNKRERAEKAKKHLKALSEWVTQEVNDLSNPLGFFLFTYEITRGYK